MDAGAAGSLYEQLPDDLRLSIELRELGSVAERGCGEPAAARFLPGRPRVEQNHGGPETAQELRGAAPGWTGSYYGEIAGAARPAAQHVPALRLSRPDCRTAPTTRVDERGHPARP